MNDKERNKEQIQICYEKMCSAMIQKDRKALETVLDDSFVLVHMTGMRQSKSEFIDAVLDSTLNYYSATHERNERYRKRRQCRGCRQVVYSGGGVRRRKTLLAPSAEMQS